MKSNTMRNILCNIQPLRGWETFLFTNPAFHAGLVKFNPCLSSRQAFGIWHSNLFVKTNFKSPKDFNISNPECNSGHKQKVPPTLKGLNID